MTEEYKIWESKAKILGVFNDFEISVVNKWGEELAILTAYNGTSENLTIPPVDEIDYRVFYNNKKIKNVIIPETVRYIGKGAFIDCINLESVDIRAKLHRIEDCVFQGCKNLHTIKFNNTLEGLGGSCFRGCHKLTRIKLPSNLKFIEGWAFCGTRITNLKIGERLNDLHKYALHGMPSLRKITFLSDKFYFNFTEEIMLDNFNIVEEVWVKPNMAIEMADNLMKNSKVKIKVIGVD